MPTETEMEELGLWHMGGAFIASLWVVAAVQADFKPTAVLPEADGVPWKFVLLFHA